MFVRDAAGRVREVRGVSGLRRVAGGDDESVRVVVATSPPAEGSFEQAAVEVTAAQARGRRGRVRMAASPPPVGELAREASSLPSWWSPQDRVGAALRRVGWDPSVVAAASRRLDAVAEVFGGAAASARWPGPRVLFDAEGHEAVRAAAVGGFAGDEVAETALVARWVAAGEPEGRGVVLSDLWASGVRGFGAVAGYKVVADVAYGAVVDDAPPVDELVAFGLSHAPMAFGRVARADGVGWDTAVVVHAGASRDAASATAQRLADTLNAVEREVAELDADAAEAAGYGSVAEALRARAQQRWRRVSDGDLGDGAAVWRVDEVGAVRCAAGASALAPSTPDPDQPVWERSFEETTGLVRFEGLGEVLDALAPQVLSDDAQARVAKAREVVDDASSQVWERARRDGVAAAAGQERRLRRVAGFAGRDRGVPDARYHMASAGKLDWLAGAPDPRYDETTAEASRRGFCVDVPSTVWVSWAVEPGEGDEATSPDALAVLRVPDDPVASHPDGSAWEAGQISTTARQFDWRDAVEVAEVWHPKKGWRRLRGMRPDERDEVKRALREQHPHAVRLRAELGRAARAAHASADVCYLDAHRRSLPADVPEFSRLAQFHRERVQRCDVCADRG